MTIPYLNRNVETNYAVFITENKKLRKKENKTKIHNKKNELTLFLFFHKRFD